MPLATSRSAASSSSGSSSPLLINRRSRAEQPSAAMATLFRREAASRVRVWSVMRSARSEEKESEQLFAARRVAIWSTVSGAAISMPRRPMRSTPAGRASRPRRMVSAGHSRGGR